jgi:multiple antibiotic resistance protein
MQLPSSMLSSLVTIFVTIGPIETAVIFAGLTAGVHHQDQRSLALRSVGIAGLMLLVFAMFGNLVLSLLHVFAARFSCGRRYIAVFAGLDADIFEPGTILYK